MWRIGFAVLLVAACGHTYRSPPPCTCESATAAAHVPPNKRMALEAMIAKGSVLIRLDARTAGVIVPAKYASDPQLRLRVGRELDPPVPDLVIDDRGVSGSLRFDGQPFHCTVPWPALYGMQLEVPEAEQFWREDVPKDLTMP